MITLKQLQWNNCFSYGSDNELLLDENTVTQIIGTNGTGKSSIPLIIEEALYNKNSKGIKKADIPNRYQGDGYNIKLTFTKDTDSYTVSIDRKTTVKVKLEKNGEDISSHTATNTYKTIQEIIGVDFKTFSQLVYQSTNASLQFLTATDTNRKKFLIDLLHLEGYVELFDVFKEESRKLTVEISGAQAAVDTVQKWLSDNKLSDSTILPMLDLRINTEEEEKEFRHLTKEIENILERNKKISKNNQLIELLGQIDLQDIQNPSVTERKSYDALQEEVGNFTQIAAGSKRLLTKLNQLGDTCPTCEQSVDATFVEELKKEETDKISVSEREIGNIEAEIKSIKRDNNEFTRLQTLESDWKEIYRSVDRNIPTSLLDKNELESRLESVRTELLQRKEQLESTAKENEKRTKHNTRIQVIQEQTDSFLKQSEELQEVLEKQQGLASNLDVLKKAFSTNGLLAYKIENLVKELEEMANTYLAELSDGRFTLEFVVSNDKLNVQVTDDGKIVDILALSSGELARVNTATLIAIRKLMSSISKSKLNILFLDEVIAVLDDTGREKLVEVLIEEDLNTYIVSHGWTHPLLDKIEVVKEENISRLE
jgi:DNA repair exonuclease SbcCD ATPase subunit|tara:strand:- start:2978 stop:4771 length:1794 start_codon:yes stop_codon:yes gene_type:complete